MDGSRGIADGHSMPGTDFLGKSFLKGMHAGTLSEEI
jgi:hypothetical protein